MDQVVFEVLQYTTYAKDICNWFFLNKENYKEYEVIRKKLKDQGRKSLILHKDGEHREWYPNGQLKVKYSYNEHRKFHGLYRWWYKNGQLEGEANFEDKQLHGLCREWYENGQLGCEKNYRHNKLHGLCRWWYENGQLESEYTYEQDFRHGLYREWYETGQLKSEGNYNHIELTN